MDMNTGLTFERLMSIASMEEYLKEHPYIERYLGNQTNPMVDSVRIGVRTTDNGFKDVLQQIHARTAGSQLDKVAKI